MTHAKLTGRDILSTMHLGSVLVGIMVGVVIGLLIGRLARRHPRQDPRQDTPDEWVMPSAAESAAPVPDPVSPAPVPAGREVQPQAEIGEVRSAAEPGLDQEPAELPAEQPREDRQPLLDELLAANRRLMDEAQTRLSREAEDVPAETREAASQRAVPPSSGEDLLARSRRLAEDAKQRLARENDPESS
jgi:hypothetical protein